MVKYGKVDLNQSKIVEGLRSLGYSVAITSDLGQGFPDLVVGGIDRKTQKPCNWLMEIKTPGNDLTKPQKTFHLFWRGSIEIIETLNDALRIIGVL